jgi:hypothetical protein
MDVRKPLFSQIDWSDNDFRRNMSLFWIEFWWQMGLNIIPFKLSFKYVDFFYRGADMFYIFPWARRGAKKFYSVVDWLPFDTFEEYHFEMKRQDKELEELNKKWQETQKDLNGEKLEINWD